MDRLFRQRPELPFRRIVVFTLAVLALFAVWGCAEECDLMGDELGDGILPTLASIQEAVFTPMCAVCHTPGGTGPMPLDSEAASYDSLVTAGFSVTCAVPRVDPGNPDGSCLVLKLEGSILAIGKPMPPPPSPPLQQDQLDAIRGWILDGALP